MRLYTSEQVRAAEKHLIQDLNVPSLVLMEHAARAVYEELLRLVPRPQRFKFFILYGPGNNGGDALALARMLALISCDVFLIETLGEPKTDDAKFELALLSSLYNTKKIRKLSISDAKSLIDQDSIVIDGIFGTGFSVKNSRTLDGGVLELLSKLSKAKLTISIDLPSGLDADSGELTDWAVKADYTISFIYPKVGLFISPGATHVGKLKVKKLLMPDTEQDSETSYELITKHMVKKILEPYRRKKESHKGSYGHLAIIAPKPGMEGAVALAARAALSSGLGLLSILAVDETIVSLRSRMRGLMAELVIDEYKNGLDKYDSILIGPGLGTSNKEVLVELLKQEKPLIVDADAINIISKDSRLMDFLKIKDNTVLTPHPGEFSRLFPEFSNVQKSRLSALERFLREKELSSCLLLKGYNSMLALNNLNSHKIYVNSTGGPALAKGGSGDVLSGIISSFSAQGMRVSDATIAAVYIHGLCADMLVKNSDKSDFSVLPSDIIDNIGAVIKCLTR